MADAITLPGFVNAHSHTFQRALRGRAGGGDFWAWRELMLAEAERQTPESVRELYARRLRRDAPRRLHRRRRVPLPRARRGARGRGGGRRARASSSCCSSPRTRAADCRGCGRRLPPSTCASSSRCGRTASSVGLAPHSVRACPRDWLEELGRYAAAEGLPLHVHACEQPREIEECLAEHGCRPIELLARTGCLGPHATVVHATHADGAELDLLAESGATVCACPTTEADLADGFLPAARIDHRRIPLSHRLRLERPHRPVRGATRAGGDRPPPDRQARRLLDRAAALLRRRRGRRARSGSSPGRRSRSTLGHESLRGVEPADVLRRARLELLGGRRQRRMRRCTQNAVRSRYAVSAARPCRPQAPSYDS